MNKMLTAYHDNNIDLALDEYIAELEYLDELEKQEKEKEEGVC